MFTDNFVESVHWVIATGKLIQSLSFGASATWVEKCISYGSQKVAISYLRNKDTFDNWDIYLSIDMFSNKIVQKGRWSGTEVPLYV